MIYSTKELSEMFGVSMKAINYYRTKLDIGMLDKHNNLFRHISQRFKLPARGFIHFELFSRQQLRITG